MTSNWLAIDCTVLPRGYFKMIFVHNCYNTDTHLDQKKTQEKNAIKGGLNGS